jgi:cyanophycinase-like exopeptidase
MARAAAGQVLAIMGSGETSPTMVTVHKALIAGMGGQPAGALLLQTPYAFQENCADISTRARQYFDRSVGLTVSVFPDDADDAAGLAPLRTAGWVFSGPGSPTYALARWDTSGVSQALRDRIAAGHGLTVMASAAAATIGCATLPVYEIYKAGADPHWLGGVGLLGLLDLPVALIPHYNNTEGGTHDTRYCYLGERRLARMERDLPAGAAVLGVDEHTAAVIDLAASTLAVTGRGTVTVRRAGRSTVLPTGTQLSLADLRRLIRGEARAAPAAPAAGPASSGASPHGASPAAGYTRDAAPLPLPELTALARERFDAADRAGDVPAMVTAILDLEAAICDWATDTEEDQGTAQSRAVLRGLITQLGQRAAEAAARGAPPARLAGLVTTARDGNGGSCAPPGLGRVVEPLLTLRAQLRDQGSWPAADSIRDALLAAGFRLQDTPDGTRWTIGPDPDE